ncbi:hypothetical protein LCGC14_1559620 [marine sediment metagenome]|uniref:GST N-terminal domain-containing protein n=1 Tax=marine sediment metagenome TaxID=412755 RepID=A0A0F9IMW6_9ZZZZ
MMRLHDYALSGNCFKIRLLLGWLGVKHTIQIVDFYPGFEHRSDAFLKINPLGQLPVIEDQGEVIRDAQAVLVYLASSYDTSGKWYPAAQIGAVHQWLAFGDALTGTISAARLHDAMFFELDVEKARDGAVKLLRVLDDHLWFAETSNQMWLCPGDHPTIADIACFPYVALAEEAGVDMAPFGAIQRWIERFMRIDGFEPMAGMMPLTMPKEA